MRVLVVEDDSLLARRPIDVLVRAGHAVDSEAKRIRINGALTEPTTRKWALLELAMATPRCVLSKDQWKATDA